MTGTGSIERCSTCKVGTTALTGGCPKPGGILEHQLSVAAPEAEAACALLSSARARCGTAGDGDQDSRRERGQDMGEAMVHS